MGVNIIKKKKSHEDMFCTAALYVWVCCVLAVVLPGVLWRNEEQLYSVIAKLVKNLPSTAKTWLVRTQVPCVASQCVPASITTGAGTSGFRVVGRSGLRPTRFRAHNGFRCEHVAKRRNAQIASSSIYARSCHASSTTCRTCAFFPCHQTSPRTFSAI